MDSKESKKILDTIENARANAEKTLNELESCKQDLSCNNREKRLKIFLTKLVGSAVIGMSVILGGWELALFLYQKWELDVEANQFYIAAQNIFLKENNPEVAIIFIEKAINSSNKSEYRFFKTYIEGLASVRVLLNLDRPYTKEELDSADMLIAESLVLKQLEPESVEPYILQGQIYSALGEHKKAVKELENAIKIDIKSSYAHIRLGVAYLYSDRKDIPNAKDMAIKEFNKAIEIDNTKWGHLWLGIINSEFEKKFSVARINYEKALSLDKKFDLAHYNIAWSYIKEKKYLEAKNHFLKALKINPNYKEAYYGLGMLYGYQNKYEIAKIYFSKAIKFDSDYTTAYKWRGIVNSEIKKYEEAVNDLTKAIEISPQDIKLYTRRAGIYIKNSQMEFAAKDLLYALEIKPNDKKTIFYLGRLYVKMDNYESALSYLNKALNIKTSKTLDEDIHKEKATVFLHQNNFDLAIKQMDKSIMIGKYRPQRLYFYRAQIKEKAGDINGSIEDLDEVLKLQKNYSKAYFELAKIKFYNRIKGAKKDIDKFLELKPTNKKGIDLKNQIYELEDK